MRDPGFRASTAIVANTHAVSAADAATDEPRQTGFPRRTVPVSPCPAKAKASTDERAKDPITQRFC
ncbi:hypothetical protein GCM10023333_42470 [Ferrimonas pelagia]|uniref:Uncharacterized protein n=1 Tax=Ferrimonas pelagia TaxID=1177826 RepID=A0ABP9FIX5_9GAMM